MCGIFGFIFVLNTLNNPFIVFFFRSNAFRLVDGGLIPTGELKDVKRTLFDFTQFHAIIERINESNEQLTYGKGMIIVLCWTKPR